MFPLCAWTEEECVMCYVCEGLGVGENFNVELCKEGLIQVVEDGVLRVDFDRLDLGVGDFFRLG